MSLGWCPVCKRHARPGACPFCKAKQMSALLAVAATGPFDCNTTAPAYGGPPVPPPTVTATATPDSGIDASVRTAVPAYGLPPRPTPAPTPSVEIGPIQKPK